MYSFTTYFAPTCNVGYKKMRTYNLSVNNHFYSTYLWYIHHLLWILASTEQKKSEPEWKLKADETRQRIISKCTLYRLGGVWFIHTWHNKYSSVSQCTWFDMIYIQWVVCFLSQSLEIGKIRKHVLLNVKYIKPWDILPLLVFHLLYCSIMQLCFLSICKMKYTYVKNDICLQHITLSIWGKNTYMYCGLRSKFHKWNPLNKWDKTDYMLHYICTCSRIPLSCIIDDVKYKHFLMIFVTEVYSDNST
jgi:hypothetical protein